MNVKKKLMIAAVAAVVSVANVFWFAETASAKKANACADVCADHDQCGTGDCPVCWPWPGKPKCANT